MMQPSSFRVELKLILSLYFQEVGVGESDLGLRTGNGGKGGLGTRTDVRGSLQWKKGPGDKKFYQTQWL